MLLEEEYRLSEYVDLGRLNENEKVHIVRNKVNGVIGVRKSVAPDLKEIYLFLKKNPNPYIPEIYECIQTETDLIVIEEYLSGKNLEEMLRETIFSEREAADVSICLCRALRPLHHAKMPVICRDLKAENVIITNEGKVKLIDFDIARIYQPGKSRDTVMMGTEGYAAPEQFGFGQTDARTDIYAMGVLLNYMLMHCFPLERITEGHLKPVVLKCISLNPKDRYQNVDELENAVSCAVRISYHMEDITVHKQEPWQKQENKTENNFVGKDNPPFYKIPGFRSGKTWKMIAAVSGYAFVTFFFWTLELSDSKGQPLAAAELTLERLVLWLSQIAFIFFVCDYMGIREKIPVVNSRKRLIRLIGYVAAEFIFILVAAIVCVTLEALLF